MRFKSSEIKYNILDKRIGLSMIKKTGNSIIDKLIKNMVFVKGGKFMMGTEEKYARKEGKPIHKVTLSDFFINKYTVSQIEWEEVMKEKISDGEDGDFPMTFIRWNRCIDFINRLNQITNLHFILPSEAQWEFAAKGGNLSKGYRYSGGDDLKLVGWNEFSGLIAESGYKLPNELGLYDMSGNIWECCQDYYGNYSKEAQYNPSGPIAGINRVIRGGSSCSKERFCRVTARGDMSETIRWHSDDNEIGLRLALNPLFFIDPIPIAINNYAIDIVGDFFCAVFGPILSFDENNELVDFDGGGEVLHGSKHLGAECCIALLRIKEAEYVVRIIPDPMWGKDEVSIFFKTNTDGEFVEFTSRTIDFIPMEVIELLRQNGFLVDQSFEPGIICRDIKIIN